MAANLNPSQYQAAVFEAFVSSAANYRHGLCGENILGLVSEVIKRDLAAGRSTAVLQLFPSGEDRFYGADLEPMRAIKRHTYGMTPRWSHHVFFVAEGRVYDYDFAGKQGEGFSDYMGAMWGSQLFDCPIKSYPVCRFSNAPFTGETTVRKFNDCLKGLGLPQDFSSLHHLGEWDNLSQLKREELASFSARIFQASL